MGLQGTLRSRNAVRNVPRRHIITITMCILTITITTITKQQTMDRAHSIRYASRRTRSRMPTSTVRLIITTTITHILGTITIMHHDLRPCHASQQRPS